MTARLLSILGMWMIVSPLLLLSAQSTRWNGLATGLVAMLLGSWLHTARSWPKFLAIILGAWTFASSSIQRLQLNAIPDVNAVLTGILLIVAGLAATRTGDRVETVPPPAVR